MRVVAELGYEEPTPIQREAIPALLAGRDVLGQAATGTGKTAAFALPLLHALGAHPPTGKHRPVRGLVLVPTRELAMQVAEALHRYGKALGVRAVPIYGGQPIDRQLRALHDGVDVVIATPGRAIDHIKRRSLSLTAVEMVIIDEADEMLDMGFAEDLEAILAETPKESRQTSLFSATLAPRIVQIANRHLRDPLHLRIAREQKKGGGAASERVRQQAYVVARQHKVATVVRVLDVERPALAIIFCRTREGVETLHEALSARGFTVDLLHGGMSQEQRDRAMRRFRTEQVELLVATDVAARGLDVKGISHVVNFDVPPEPEDYIHRIGRTGRAGREGVAITLIEPREHRLLRNIERAADQRIEVASIPTVADLRARKLELTTSAVREALADDAGLEQFRVVLDALTGEHDLVQIALAAVKLAHVAEQGGAEDDEREIPRAPLPHEMRQPPFGGHQQPQRGFGPRGQFQHQPPPHQQFQHPPSQHRRDDGPEPRARTFGKQTQPARGYGPGPGPSGAPHAAPPMNTKPGKPSKPGKQKAPPRDLGATARMFVGAGRTAGVRAKDLVGAIANEAGIEGRQIGAIEITDGYSLVELPADRIDEVVGRLGNLAIFNKPVSVRRNE